MEGDTQAVDVTLLVAPEADQVVTPGRQLGSGGVRIHEDRGQLLGHGCRPLGNDRVDDLSLPLK